MADPAVTPDWLAGRDLVLVGMMGTGKSTVGRLLANRLRRSLFDSDELVERRTGKTVRELWVEHGEPGYRDLETAALRDAIGTTTGGAVIAAAGGVVLREENRRLLRDGGAYVVWFRAAPESVYARIRASIEGGHRPLLDHDPLGTLRRMASEREALYCEVAHAVVDVDALTPNQVAEQVVSGRATTPDVVERPNGSGGGA